MQLFRPTRSKRVSQWFGENKACMITRIFRVITKVRGVCPTGSKGLYALLGMLGHNGIDIPGLRGEHVVHCAMFDGHMETHNKRNVGLGVDVISNEMMFFEGTIPTELKGKVTKVKDGYKSYVKLRFWHLMAHVGYDGKQVKFGQVIGLMGNTGMSSGVHLHWSYKICDKDGISLGKSNGYFGAYNPARRIRGVTYDHTIFAGDSARMLDEEQKMTTAEQRKMMQEISLLQYIILQLRELIARL